MHCKHSKCGLSRRQQHGFTLIEAVVSLSIASVLLAIGLPSLNSLLERQRATAALDLLRADISLARNTALMKRQQVVVCPGSAHGCRAGGDWTAGWVVFLDPNKDRVPAALTDLLSIGPPLPEHTLRAHSNRPLLRYQADGRSAASNLTINFCSRDTLAGHIKVNNSGRARSRYADTGIACPGPGASGP